MRNNATYILHFLGTILLCVLTVRRWRTSVFTKNTIVHLRYLAYLSIDFSGKMGYNCYRD